MAEPGDGEAGDFRVEPPGEGGGEASREEASLRRIEVLNLALVVAASLVALGVSGPFFWGVVAGGALNAANFRIVASVVRSMFLGRRSVTAVNAGLYWFKFTALLAVVGALILWVKVDGVGFVVGLTTLLIAIAVEASLRLMVKS
jgi:hypothetical protein